MAWSVNVLVPANGRVHKGTVEARYNGELRFTDKANLEEEKERRRLAKRLAQLTGEPAEDLENVLQAEWIKGHQKRQQEQARQPSNGAPDVGILAILDRSPDTIARPLCLLSGRAFAAAWVPVQQTLTQSVQDGVLVQHNPPLVQVEETLLIVTGDGIVYADRGVPNARPFAELRVLVRLPMIPPPGRGWSGAGVKRYLAGERPNPADVFRRIASAVNRFLDFSRSLASQETMCELVASAIVSTYLLDAFHVVGYLWPNGEPGTGKTSFLQVFVELAYLGQLILAGSTYACLRDLADYGATLAFDDAEAVMDTRRTDPDKRTLLLAGNRRGATVAVKELEGDNWKTRHVSTFCPRLFSAIRLPDEVLGSRSIIVPLVRSGDSYRAKANCLDPEDWPCERRRLVDDLWALGLAHLTEIPAHDREAAAAAHLAGRTLDPWRPILAVAHWLQERHEIEGLFDRLEALSMSYQVERAETEAEDRTRVLFRALLQLTEGERRDRSVPFLPGRVSEVMNEIARSENLTDGDRPFTTPRRVGWLLKRCRFRRSRDRSDKGKPWEATRAEIEQAARAYGLDVPADAEANQDEVPF
jgi:hypothetical protein